MSGFITIWEFTVPPEHRREFETAYGSNGSWARLFRRHPDYVRSDLISDSEEPGRYVTVDEWTSEASYLDFLSQFQEEYRSLDASCEALTASERKLGSFTLDTPFG